MAQGASAPPLSSVIVPRGVVGRGEAGDEVVVGVVVVVLVVGGVVVVVEDAVDDEVVEVVVVVVVAELDKPVVLSSSLPPETTASAIPSPMTAAIRTAISAFMGPLIPESGGSPGGWSWPPP